VLSSRNNSRIAENETKIKSTEGAAAELRQQLQQKDAELERLRCSLSSEQQARVDAQARLEETNKNIEEQRRIFVKYDEKLKDNFNTLAYNALRDNQQAFLDLARKTLEGLLTEAKAEMGERQQAIETTVKPLRESLTRYEQLTKELEESRADAYVSLKQDLDQISKTNQQFKKEVANLNKALKKIDNIAKAKEKEDAVAGEDIRQIEPLEEDKPLAGEDNRPSAEEANSLSSNEIENAT
jgi:DNA recombination protein RmuC